VTEVTSPPIPTHAKAVRFDHYGGRDVLHLADVAVPRPSEHEVLVAVRAAGVNPGEAAIREGRMDAIFPARFPSGEGSDLAGVIVATAADSDPFAVGDEVLGWTDNRASHAEYVIVPVSHLVRKPAQLSWAVAGSLYVAGVTAYAAVTAVGAQAGDCVAVSAAAGGVGVIAVQLLRRAGAKVIGIASKPHHDLLSSLGAIPVEYGEGLSERLREAAPEGIDAFIDTFGGDYVQLAVDLGVAPERIDTIIAFDAAQAVGAKTEGSASASTADVLGKLVQLLADGSLTVPIAAVFPLAQVRDAFAQLEQRHTSGKIVLTP